MRQPEPIKWLLRGRIADEGPRTAQYPYTKLRNIQEPVDCRTAILDETDCFEREFGKALVQPFYDLVWEINVSPGVFTSHVACSSERFIPAGFAAGVGALVVIQSRNFEDQATLQAIQGLCDCLCGTLASSPLARQLDPEGGWMEVRPTRVDFYCSPHPETGVMRATTVGRPGYACELITAGCGQSRSEAARGWGVMCSFAAAVLRSCTPVAPPFDQSIHFPV
jgi:hypothetical protein